MQLHIGLDDTDSPEGGCTTYLAATLVERFLELGATFTDYPTLLRLNPNAPWKTRGNASVCIRIEIEPELGGAVKEETLEAVETQGEFECENTNPGVVFHRGDVPRPLEEFSERVVRSIVSLEEAEGLIDEHCSSAVGYKNGRGLIGALAAVGGTLEGDHTYELLAYRTPPYRGRERLVDASSVRRMDEVMKDSTFNNVDPGTGRPLITPHGPDPVLFGVRGETPEAVRRAATMVEVGEPVERWVIFRSNQGTDAHLKGLCKVAEMEPFHPAVVQGRVLSRPETMRGGHVFFRLGDETGETDCAAYEPTGPFRKVVRKLAPGDGLRACGGVRAEERFTLNLEKFEVLSLAPETRLMNPRCPRCGGSTESMGFEKGHRCRKCGFRGPDLGKVELTIARGLEPGLYLPPPRAHRHLTKPLERYGREKEHEPGPLYEPWHWP